MRALHGIGKRRKGRKYIDGKKEEEVEVKKKKRQGHSRIFDTLEDYVSTHVVGVTLPAPQVHLVITFHIPTYQKKASSRCGKCSYFTYTLENFIVFLLFLLLLNDEHGLSLTANIS